jgi:hypothetical protein
MISTIQWFVDGRKNFTGPRADVGVEVAEAVISQSGSDLADPTKSAEEMGNRD